MQDTGLRVDTNHQQHPAPGGSPAALGRVAPSDPAKGSGRFIDWDEATRQQVREWAAAGMSQRAIGKRLGMAQFSVATRMRKAGIKTKIQQPRNDEMERGAAALREHFCTMAGIREVLARYHEARGNTKTTIKGMRTHARKLGLVRPADAEMAAAVLGSKVFQQNCHAANLALAPQVQQLLQEGHSGTAIARRLRISHRRFKRMEADGLITIPVGVPLLHLARAPKPPKVKKEAAPPKPKALPKSWVRAAPPPPKPKPVYESVEAWLAAGNQIKRCPTVAVEATTAKIPEADRAALMALYAERERNKVTGRNGAAMRATNLARGRAHGWLT